MRQSKHQFYHRGTDTQKAPDITIDLRRKDNKHFKDWTEEEKKHTLDFLTSCEKVFATFIEEIKKTL